MISAENTCGKGCSSCGEAALDSLLRKCGDLRIMSYCFSGDSGAAGYFPFLLLTIHHYTLLDECWEDVGFIDGYSKHVRLSVFSEPIICKDRNGDDVAVILIVDRDGILSSSELVSKVVFYSGSKFDPHDEHEYPSLPMSSIIVQETDFCSLCIQSKYLFQGQKCEFRSKIHVDVTQSKQTLYFMPQYGPLTLRTGQLSGPYKREARKLYSKLFETINLHDDGLKIFNCESFKEAIKEDQKFMKILCDM